METKEKCPNKATCIYPWAGKIMKACKDHAHAMSRLAKAIGLDLEIRSIPESAEMCMHMDDLNQVENGG